MRLCIATPLYPPEPGGPATYARILETELPKESVEVSLVKFGDFRHLPKIVRHIEYFFAVCSAGKKADAILALDPVSTGLPALFAARVLRKPFFVKIVGDYAWEQGSQRYGVKDTLDEFVRRNRVALPVLLLRFVQTRVARAAKKVIVPSVYLKGIVTAWGITEEHIAVIYNAMQEENLGIVPERVEKLSRPRVVTVGRLVPWKHVDAVIDAVALIDTSAPSLVVVGDGPERARLSTRAHARLGQRGLLTGALSHADVLSTIADADVFVLNSSYEGLSHLLIESLSLGTPSIATAVGGNPELITHGENGLLVPAGDTEALKNAIEKLLTDTSYARELGERAKESAKRYTTGTMVEHTKSLLEENV